MTVWGWEMTSAMTRWLGDVLEMDGEDQRDRGRFWQLPSGGSSRPRLRSVPSPVGRCGRRWPRTRGCRWEWSRSGSRTSGPRWRKCRGGTRWTKTGSQSRRTPRKIKKVRHETDVREEYQLLTWWLSGERGVGDNDSYCDSEASMDDGSCYDNLEDVASPPPSELSHQTLDLRHQDNVALRVSEQLMMFKFWVFKF